MAFANRREAGRQLAERLAGLDLPDPVVLALPRGGVPVAAEVARRLGAPLDVLIVRKLGCPWQPELGIGAVGEGGVRSLNRELVARLGIGEVEIEDVAARERVELERRVRTYRGDREAVDVTGRTVVLVDDGLATGFTARTGIDILRGHGAGRVVLAVPVAPQRTVEELGAVADSVVCLEAPAAFAAIGQWYEDFRQTGDREVQDLLAESRAAAPDGSPATGGPASRRDVEVIAGGERLGGRLHVPAGAAGAVVFAHGSGSSRLSPRNVAVARALEARGLATLLFDLLTPVEAGDRTNVFDVELLAERLRLATVWLRGQPEARGRPIGYFGASTGAAAALVAAANLGGEVAAVVSRGGRPDLAGGHLGKVTAPTLLIVGGRDEAVLELNRVAQLELRCEHRLEVVAGATHLFEEPGALEEVARLAGEWLTTHLGGP